MLGNTIGAIALCVLGATDGVAADGAAFTRYQDAIEPLLIDHCHACHANGSKKGGVTFEGLESGEAILAKRDLWLSVLKNVRAGVMPPAGKPRLSTAELTRLSEWIKRDVLGGDPRDPDPGRVTIRRLNRAEYRNTIRDLTGVDFKAEEEFPPDDTGYGFDTIGDVLTVSPLLLEKYMQAAENVVAAAVPLTSRMMSEKSFRGFELKSADGKTNGSQLSYYKPAKLARSFSLDNDAMYRVTLEFAVNGAFEFDPGRCDATFRLDDQTLFHETLSWHNGKTFRHTFDKPLKKGEHKLGFEIEPLTPLEKKKTGIDLRLARIQILGPLEEAKWVRSDRYDRFWPRKEPPSAAAERRDYARLVSGKFATRAFRRPVDESTLERLVALAEGVYQHPGQRFEDGVARAIVAILSSPRFVFRLEHAEPVSGSKYPLIDEYALASRLSYFLWSTMPDDELIQLAGHHELRKNLGRQLARMTADSRFDALTRNFVGQWLLVRDVEGMSLNIRAIMRQEGGGGGGGRGRFELDSETRRAMRRETEMAFAHVAREDRSVLDWIDCDYTFVNARLAQLYGLKSVTGRDMRKVDLPADSPRGGVLTDAAVLMVTSNPDRTSPVKRGKFILENILGTPPPEPPADIPALEASKKELKGKEPTVRELMALHRSSAGCASCHSRMDPLGLAFENFNAMGLWRDKERGAPIDASAQLITGESFHQVKELKRILKERHRLDFYRCLTEKLMTYALGRGVETTDLETIDQIVDRLDKDNGKFSTLLTAIVESAPFQRRRETGTTAMNSGPSTTLNKAPGKP